MGSLLRESQAQAAHAGATASRLSRPRIPRHRPHPDGTPTPPTTPHRPHQEFEPAFLDDMAALEPAPHLKRSAPDCKNDVDAEPEVVVLLKRLVRSLQESLQERDCSRPEIPLLEYYNLREQENSSAAMEAWAPDDFLISLKIESLEAENRRLATDHRETKGELESAKAKDYMAQI